MKGKKFNRLLVIEAEPNRNGRKYWKCECDCGNITSVRDDSLKSGKVRSCGCLRAENSYRTHGMHNTKIYRVWAAMLSRTNNPNDPAWKYYGAIGIGLAQDDWKQFENFYRDMGDSYEEGLTLERKEVTLGYSKENCVWDTWKTQSFNKGMFKNNKSGRTGVRWVDNMHKWQARIGFEGKDINLGYFDTYEEACCARANGEIKYFGRTKE